MTTIEDSQLLEYHYRVVNQVVLITGASNGIGRAAALLFGKHRARVVIGDIDEEGARSTAADIIALGGKAVYQKTDVREYNSLVSLFQFAVEVFERVDVVIPCAGITELGDFCSVKLDKDGVPLKPNLKTTEINLISVMWTVYLAQHYLDLNWKLPLVPLSGLDGLPTPEFPFGRLKAVVLIGSVASIQGIPRAPNYSAAKHGIIGLMGSLMLDFRSRGVRIATISPWFADTAIVPTPVKIMLSGIPFAPVTRIASAIFQAATDPDHNTSGSVYTIPDGGSVFRLEQETLNEGVYKLLNNRLRVLAKQINWGIYIVSTVRDIWRALGTKLLLAAWAIALGILVRRQMSQI